MSLLFDASGELVTISDAASIRNILPFTVLVWARLDTETTSVPRILVKFNPADGIGLDIGRTGTTIFGSLSRNGGTTNSQVDADQANFTHYSEGTQMFLAVVLDDTTNSSCKMFLGNLSNLAAEPSAYSIQAAGSGVIDSTSGFDMFIGNRSDGARPADGTISFVGMWNRLLTTGEIHAQQMRPHVTSGCVLFQYLGYNGTGTQRDYSGNANSGTVTSATVADHVPRPFRRRRVLTPSRAAVATDQTIWQLGAMTDPATGDLLVAVDDPAGTPATKKLTLANLGTLTVSNVVVQTKTAGSGTYTPTAGMKKVLAIAVGGGGGGAGGINTDSAGGGGGGGGTVIRLMTDANIGASKAYVVGTGGAATSNGNATTLDTAGALMNAGGGSAGTAGATFSVVGVSVAGGAGGTASNGDLNIPGQPGKRGIIYSGADGQGGAGGQSAFGFGGASGGTNVAGNTGQAYGGGGSGGHASTATDRAGAAGADGILYLIEFIG